MLRRVSALVGVVSISAFAVSPALASTRSERSQDKRISQALKNSSSASKTAKSAAKSAKSAQRGANSAIKTANAASALARTANAVASGAQATLTAVLGQINAYGMVAPELGVATVYAGNGPPSGNTGTPLSAIGTVFTGQIPRGGNNAAQATGTVLYQCTGPSANPSAGCDVQLRAAIRTTRTAGDVSGSVGGGVVITQLNNGATNNAVFGALTGSAGPGHDPVGSVGYASRPPPTVMGRCLRSPPESGSASASRPITPRSIWRAPGCTRSRARCSSTTTSRPRWRRAVEAARRSSPGHRVHTRREGPSPEASYRGNPTWRS